MAQIEEDYRSIHADMDLRYMRYVNNDYRVANVRNDSVFRRIRVLVELDDKTNKQKMSDKERREQTDRKTIINGHAV